jgi:hypothetical protein
MRLVEWWYNENTSWTKRYLLTFKFRNYNFWLIYMHQFKCHQKAKPESHPLESMRILSNIQYWCFYNVI